MISGQTHEDRRQALEKLGISVASSGIKVEKNRCFLVNLNSDPSLSEMLVYYLKERTMIGRTGDIQFFGVGIQVSILFGLCIDTSLRVPLCLW
jgi:kinesin family protein 13